MKKDTSCIKVNVKLKRTAVTEVTKRKDLATRNNNQLNCTTELREWYIGTLVLVKSTRTVIGKGFVGKGLGLISD